MMPTPSDRLDTDLPSGPPVDTKPPTRSKVSAGLAALACTVSCAVPLLIAAGVLTGAGAVLLQHTLFGVAAVLFAAALGMWWLHRRRSNRLAATPGDADGH